MTFGILAISFVFAATIVIAVTPLAKRIAQRVDAVDYPSGRRVNTKPVPRLGGIAIAAGIAGSLLVTALFPHVFGASMDTPEFQGVLRQIGIAASMIGMFALGAVDDVKPLSAIDKLFWQLVFATIAAASGLVIGDIANPFGPDFIDLGIFAYPLTVLYLVSFANIINLIDGIDGLASGVSAIAAITLSMTAIAAGHADAALLAAIIAGAAVGFLRYNFNPASIFLGDSGSLLLGYGLGVVSLMGVTRAAGLTMLIVPIIIAGAPVIDTFSAIVRRTRAQVNIGQADKGHIHHRLLQSGFSQRQVALIMYVWTAALSAGAYAITMVDTCARIVLFLLMLGISVLIAWSLRLFEPVIRRRFDPETGFNEVVPIGEVAESDDLTRIEIDEVLLGGVGTRGSSVRAGKTDHPLNILAVSQHYWPEPFNISDICEGLVARGHCVTMLTGTPNYPEGAIYQGYEGGAQAEQEHNGVRIKRSPLVPRGQDLVHRVLNYYSFSANASRIARDLDAGFDVVLSFQTSPVMMANPALAYGRRYRVPVLLYCIDIWPECLTVGGIRPGSPVYNHYARVSRDIYSSADRLAVTSPLFAEYFESHLGMNGADPLYLPQYAEDIFTEDAAQRQEYDPGKVNLTFAGNVGLAQSVSTLVEAASLLVDDDRIAIHVVGSGSELETLKRYGKQLGTSNLTFHGRFPLSDMPSFYNSSDAMVATFLNSPILGYTLPRKIQSYMAAGRPILGTVVGEARRVIEEAGCGLCCDAGDAQGLADICRRFADMSSAEREAMGARGRAFYRKNYSRERFFETLDAELWELARKGVQDGE